MVLNSEAFGDRPRRRRLEVLSEFTSLHFQHRKNAPVVPGAVRVAAAAECDRGSVDPDAAGDPLSAVKNAPAMVFVVARDDDAVQKVVQFCVGDAFQNPVVDDKPGGRSVIFA